MTDGHVVLIGLMGSGKSTVGRLVAERLDRPFVDSDSQVEARTGRTVRQIWLDDGEPAFRRFEADALRVAVDADDPSVIAAAGGVVLTDQNRAILRRAGTVVWLDGEPDRLAVRAGRGDHRPLLDDDPVGALRDMADARRALYDEVSDHRIDVDGRTPDDIADEIADLVR